MSKVIDYTSADGAVGTIVDVTKEKFYREPDIELYDGLEAACYDLICDFAELIGVYLERDEVDFRLANHVRDTVIEALEEEFGIPFPVYGETKAECEERLEAAQTSLFKLANQRQYEDVCAVVDGYDDAFVALDVAEGRFIVDSGSSKSLKEIAERLQIPSADLCDSPAFHLAYIKAENEFLRSVPDVPEKVAVTEKDVADLDSQIKFASGLTDSAKGKPSVEKGIRGDVDRE